MPELPSSIEVTQILHIPMFNECPAFSCTAVPICRGGSLSKGVSRRTFFRSLSLAVCARACTIAVQALPDTATSAYAEAVAARDALKKLELSVAEGKYDVFRYALRIGPLGKVRSACAKLCAVIPEGPKRLRAEQKFRELIKAVEVVDGDALRASRGSGNNVFPAFDKTVKAFDAFLEDISQIQ